MSAGRGLAVSGPPATRAPGYVRPVGEITNTLTDPGGTPLRGLPVGISLITPLNPFLLNGSGEVLSRITVDTDNTGTWVADLVASSLLDSATAYYLVDETCAPGGQRWAITVPDGPGPFLLRDVLVAVTGGGPTGPSVVLGAHYHHDQTVPSQLWTIVHNLGYRPAVRVKDSAGGDWYGWTVVDDQPNQMTIDVGLSFGGTAELS